MSNIIRRMQRMAKREGGATKHAISVGFATQVGTTNGVAKDLLARLARPDLHRSPRRTPLVLRRSKRSQKWLEARAAKRAAAAS